MPKKSAYESGSLTDSIFLILLATIKPVHGYRIMQEIQEMEGIQMEMGPATMYTTLKKLKEARWIAEHSEGDSKILYQITPEGRAILEENVAHRVNVLDIARKYLLKEEK